MLPPFRDRNDRLGEPVSLVITAIRHQLQVACDDLAEDQAGVQPQIQRPFGRYSDGGGGIWTGEEFRGGGSAGDLAQRLHGEVPRSCPPATMEEK